MKKKIKHIILTKHRITTNHFRMCLISKLVKEVRVIFSECLSWKSEITVNLLWMTCMWTLFKKWKWKLFWITGRRDWGFTDSSNAITEIKGKPVVNTWISVLSTKTHLGFFVLYILNWRNYCCCYNALSMCVFWSPRAQINVNLLLPCFSDFCGDTPCFLEPYRMRVKCKINVKNSQWEHTFSFT